MEATMIMIDNSESSINGDHPPTRWDQEVEAANLLIEGKLADSPQASVGLGIMAGKRVQVLCAPTNNSGKLTAYLFGIPIYGEIRLNEAIKTALLAMKNRQNPNQRQRIICIIASQINDNQEQLLSLGKQLKKDVVNLDLIVCGDETLPEFERQRKRIQALTEGLKSTESTVVWVPSNIVIRDAITGSAIFADRGAADVGQSGGAPAGGNNNDFAVDPNMDPQLAMVLEASRKEYEQMMKKANQNKAPQNKPMQQQQDEDAIAERRAIQLSLEQAANVQAELKAQQQKKKKMQTEQADKKQQKKSQNPKAEDAELTKKHGDFINEFEKMDEQDDEKSKLNKKQ